MKQSSCPLRFGFRMIDPKTLPDMTALRAQIDLTDKALMDLLVYRSSLIDRAIDLKPAAGLPARTADRVEQVAQNARQNAIDRGFDPDFAEKLWRDLIEWSIAREERVLGADGSAS